MAATGGAVPQASQDRLGARAASRPPALGQQLRAEFANQLDELDAQTATQLQAQASVAQSLQAALDKTAESTSVQIGGLRAEIVAIRESFQSQLQAQSRIHEQELSELKEKHHTNLVDFRASLQSEFREALGKRIEQVKAESQATSEDLKTQLQDARKQLARSRRELGSDCTGLRHELQALQSEVQMHIEHLSSKTPDPPSEATQLRDAITRAQAEESIKMQKSHAEDRMGSIQEDVDKIRSELVEQYTSLEQLIERRFCGFLAKVSLEHEADLREVERLVEQLKQDMAGVVEGLQGRLHEQERIMDVSLEDVRAREEKQSMDLQGIKDRSNTHQRLLENRICVETTLRDTLHEQQSLARQLRRGQKEQGQKISSLFHDIESVLADLEDRIIQTEMSLGLR